MNEHPLDPTEAFAALGRIKLSGTDLGGVINKVSELAQRAIPGADEVSVTLIGAAGAYTAAYTGAVALALDERQYQQGRGPCMDAAQAGIVVSVPDTGSEDRRATARPVRRALEPTDTSIIRPRCPPGRFANTARIRIARL